jgi:hypothetical protein
MGRREWEWTDICRSQAKFRHDQYGGNIAARPAASANAGCAGSSAEANRSASARDSAKAGCSASARDSAKAGCSASARDSAKAGCSASARGSASTSGSANASLAARARAGSTGQAAGVSPFADRTRDGRAARGAAAIGSVPAVASGFTTAVTGRRGLARPRAQSTQQKRCRPRRTNASHIHHLAALSG